MPDLVTKGIIDRDLTPAFRKGDYFSGLSSAIASMQKHIGGEYTTERYKTEDTLPSFAWLIFFAFILFDFLAAFLARSKSWWMGGILGGIAGIVLTAIFSWWVSIPLLILLGSFFDFIISRTGYKSGRWRSGGWGGGRGGSSSGGFGGFGGGSFGGGGARGKW